LTSTGLTVQVGAQPQTGLWVLVTGIIPGTGLKQVFAVVRDSTGRLVDANEDTIGAASQVWGFFLDTSGPTYSLKGTYQVLVEASDGTTGTGTFEL